MTILDLKNGESFIVKRVKLGKEIGKRLVDMGFTKGVEGEVKRCALLGDPIEVKILNYNISIRKSEAKGIEIEKLEDKKNEI
jgi:Fe2+ transport system protein FeoA